MRDVPNIIEFITDPQLLNLPLSPAQEVLQRAIYALPMTSEQRDIYREFTGRQEPPTAEAPEVTVLSGARGGKNSRIGGPIASYEACFGNHERYLARGETGVIALVAQDQRSTAIAFGYIRSHFEASPILRNLLIDGPKANSLALTNGLEVRCFPSTIGAMRGWSIPVGVLDELAFWRLDGAVNADVEIQQSIRRGMVAFPRTKLVKISTPYMKSGVLYDDFTRAYAKEDRDLLVWVAPTARMNPQIGTERLERERRLDPQRYAREYEALFADDVSAFLPRDWIDRAVVPGRTELPPNRSRHAVMAIDPSGGGPDAFTCCVVFVEGDGPERRIIQAVMRGAARVGTTSPDLEALIRQYIALAREYGCSEIISDKYAAGWVKQAVERYAGITLKHSELDRSQAYLNVEPLFAQGRIECLDHPQMVRELAMLERRPRPGGKDLVEHPRNGHDDYSNALALAAAYATVKERQEVFAAVPAHDSPRSSDWQLAYYGLKRPQRRDDAAMQTLLRLRQERADRTLLSQGPDDPFATSGKDGRFFFIP